jgi:CBS domain-containing protein/anti-sigma regulatory factor (Ser/Thr protein kinase)
VEQRTASEVTKLQDLAYELTVEQAMTKDVITISPHSTMEEFGEMLRGHRISGIPVVEGGRLVGIASTEDLIITLKSCQLDTTVGGRMTPDPVTLYADEPLVHAVSKFSRLAYGRFPVINREGDLVGIITPGDIAQAMLRRLEVDYRQEELHRYRASHIFEDIIADDIAIVFGYRVAPGDFAQAGEASSGLRRTMNRLGIHPQIVRRAAVATYEAEMNIVIFSDGGEIIAEVRPDRIRVEFLDKGPGIPDIEKAMQPGFSTAPVWVQEMGFGAGMGLPNIKACADTMKLESKVGVGTRLEIVIYTE